MRLADKILTCGVEKSAHFIGSDLDWLSEVTSIKELILEAQVFLADDVSKYFFSYSVFDQEWDIKKDIPNLTPPFDVMFVEYDADLDWILEQLSSKYEQKHRALLDDVAEMIVETGGGVDELNSEWLEQAEAEYSKLHNDRSLSGRLRMGVLFTATEVKELDEVNSVCEAWDLEAGEIAQLLRFGGWVVTAEAFCYNRKSAAAGLMFEMNYLIDQQGSTLRLNEICYPYTGEAITDESDKTVEYMRKTCFIPALLTICFIHCRKKVKITKEEPLVKNSLIRKKRKLPPLSYYTLEIEPIKRLLEQSAAKGDGSQSDFKKRLHICRGHFVHYTVEAPLFGKHVGTYWRHQHVRGKNLDGIVVKDYAVKPSPEGLADAKAD